MSGKTYRKAMKILEDVAREVDGDEKKAKALKRERIKSYFHLHKEEKFNGGGRQNVYKLCHSGRREIGDTARGFKWARQRARKGYCDHDRWEMYSWFLDVIVDMLREFKIRHLGTPQEFLEMEFEENRQDYPNLKSKTDLCYGFSNDDPRTADKQLLDDRADARWNAVIDEMADNFEKVRIMDEEIWETYDENKYAKLEAQKDKAFDLFRKWFFNLWD